MKQEKISSVFGRRLRVLMDEHDLTQEDVARASGVSRGSVVKWLKSSEPSGSTLLKLSAFFHVSPESFFEEGEKSGLTYYPQDGKTNDMQPCLPKLIERLRNATEEHGMKTELAKWLGVTPQKVTDWLSSRVEPSGETTLRLLQWVEQQERQK